MPLRTRTLLGVLAAGLSLAAPPIAQAQLDPRDSTGRFAPGEAIVRFEPGLDAGDRREARADAGVSFDESLRLARTQVVSFEGGVRRAIERLEDQPGVAYAQPNYRYRALAVDSGDTHDVDQWGIDVLPGVDALPAWARTRGAGQIIAVLDTGVDLTHPDLAANLWNGPGGIHGHDYIHNDSNPNDHQYHGTHVAGSAAAVAGNNTGVAGVAPEADIMAVRVLDGEGGGLTSGIANGITFASQNGARVINMSLGGPSGSDTAMRDAARAAEQRGSVIVAAAGNNANNNDVTPFSPCNTDAANIICVAAIDNQSELASYSNYGATSVDVGAPGGDFESGDEQILSTKPAWAAPLAPVEDFEDVSDWSLSHGSGTAWGQAGSAGSRFLADSPAGNYAANTQTQFQRTSSISLSGQQGCRIHFDGRLDIEDAVDPDTGMPFDFLIVGAVPDGGGTGDGAAFFEHDAPAFFPREASIENLDGQSVKPTLQFFSDAIFQFAGADVDNLKVLCRGSDHNDVAIADPDDFELPPSQGGGSYMSISGTSMAAPHVSGVAALVLAADPGASPSQVVQAIRNGARPLPSLAGFTSTGGAVDAVRSIDASLAITNPQPQTTTPTTGGTTTTTTQPVPPTRARFGRVSVSPRGVVSILLRGDANTTGVATLSANITRPRAARVVRVARKAFRIGTTGRATVKLKLSRPAMRQLRRTRRLPLRAKAVLKNAAGLTSTATARLRITLRRR